MSQDVLAYLKKTYSIDSKNGIPDPFSHFSLNNHKCEKGDQRSLALYIGLKDDGRNDCIKGYLEAAMGNTKSWNENGTWRVVVPYENLKAAADFASELGDIYQLVDADNFSANPTEPVTLWIPMFSQMHFWYPRPSPSTCLPRQLLPAFNGDAIIGTSDYWKDDGKEFDERPIPGRK